MKTPTFVVAILLLKHVLAVLPPKLRWKQRHSELPLRYTIITAKYQILGIEPKIYWAKEDLKFQSNYLRTLFSDDLPDLKWMYTQEINEYALANNQVLGLKEQRACTDRCEKIFTDAMSTSEASLNKCISEESQRISSYFEAVEKSRKDMILDLEVALTYYKNCERIHLSKIDLRNRCIKEIMDSIRDILKVKIPQLKETMDEDVVTQRNSAVFKCYSGSGSSTNDGERNQVYWFMFKKAWEAIDETKKCFQEAFVRS